MYTHVGEDTNIQIVYTIVSTRRRKFDVYRIEEQSTRMFLLLVLLISWTENVRSLKIKRLGSVLQSFDAFTVCWLMNEGINVNHDLNAVCVDNV